MKSVKTNAKFEVQDVPSVTKFDVAIENSSDGEVIRIYTGIIAQTRAEAVNKAKQKLTFSAERA
jgi:hypothetical protein